MAQSKQSLNSGYLTDSVNAYCQAISDNTAIDSRALIAPLSRPTLFVRKPRGPFRTNGCRVPVRGDVSGVDRALRPAPWVRAASPALRPSCGPTGPSQQGDELALGVRIALDIALRHR